MAGGHNAFALADQVDLTGVGAHPKVASIGEEDP
jgi:hypothetical protein